MNGLSPRLRRTIHAKRQNGANVVIREFMVPIEDRTATGTGWSAPHLWHSTYSTEDGEPVEMHGNGKAMLPDGEVVDVSS